MLAGWGYRFPIPVGILEGGQICQPKSGKSTQSEVPYSLLGTSELLCFVIYSASGSNLVGLSCPPKIPWRRKWRLSTI